MTEDRTEQKRLLIEYLDQYRIMKRRVETLKWRLLDAQDALSCPTIRSGLSGATSCKGNVNIGAASPILKEESLSKRFEREQRQCVQIMRDVLDALDFLPISKTREILEYRHIDGMRWKEIYGQANLSRAACLSHYRRGLDLLLNAPDIQARLAAFRRSRDRVGQRDGGNS